MDRDKEKGQSLINIIIALAAICVFLFFIYFGIPLEYSVVIILCGLFFVTAFINTDLALIILILSMLLSPEVQAGGVKGRAVLIRVEDIFLIVVFLGWLAKMAINKELGLIRATPLNLPMGIYILICLVSSSRAIMAGGINLKTSFFYILKYIEYFLLFFMVLNHLRTLKQAKRFVFFILLTCFLVCCYSYIKIPAGERITAPFETEGGEPNTFSGYLVLLMGIILGRILHSENGKKRLIFIGFFVFIIPPFIYTLSRGGWIAFFPMILTLIILNKKYRVFLLASFVIFLIFMPSFLPKIVKDRIKEAFAPEKTYQVMGRRLGISESAAARIDSWKLAKDMVLTKPFIGLGTPAASVVDNQYSRLLVETGILGFTTFFWMLILIFILSLRTYSLTQDNNFAQGITLGFIAGFSGLLVHALGAASFILIRIMEPFWFIFAIVLVLPELLDKERNERKIAQPIPEIN